MSLVGNGEGLSAADVAAVVGNGVNGSGFGYGEGGWFWIVILFLFFMQNGWGNGANNGNGCGNGYIVSDVQRGFDQSAVMGGLNNLSTAVTSGFAGVTNGFSQAEISANARQMANMNQDFASQTAIMGAINNLSMGLQNCCCENRAATADLKYTVATEACADRTAVNDALRDVVTNQTANTNALMQTINNGIQSIQDKLCQQEIDALKSQNANLQTQLNLANLQASQNGQTSQLLQDNAAQTAALLRQLNPTPVPAYPVQNPNGCGCGNAWQQNCCA